MRSDHHLETNVVVLTILGIITFIFVIQSVLIVVGVYMGIIMGQVSDLDLVLKRKFHRHFLFHSIFFLIGLWIIVWFYPEVQLLIAFFMIGTGLHCIEDIQLYKRSMRGTYTIKTKYKKQINRDGTKSKKKRVSGLSGINSTYWLIMNFVLSIVMYLITIMRIWIL